MEKKLKKLFDYQKFAQNEDLNKIINETPDFEELFESDLAFVSGGQKESQEQSSESTKANNKQ